MLRAFGYYERVTPEEQHQVAEAHGNVRAARLPELVGMATGKLEDYRVVRPKLGLAHPVRQYDLSFALGTGLKHHPEGGTAVDVHPLDVQGVAGLRPDIEASLNALLGVFELGSLGRIAKQRVIIRLDPDIAASDADVVE